MINTIDGSVSVARFWSASIVVSAKDSIETSMSFAYVSSCTIAVPELTSGVGGRSPGAVGCSVLESGCSGKTLQRMFVDRDLIGVLCFSDLFSLMSLATMFCKMFSRD